MSGEYPREPVPAHEATRPAATLGFIIINAVIGVPIIFLATTLGRDYGSVGAAVVIVGGCVLTAGLAMLAAWVGVRTRRSTALLAEQAFGRRGALCLNIVLALALLGWLAVEMGFIGQLIIGSVKLAFGSEMPTIVAVGIASIVTGGATLFGIAMIARAPRVFVPLLLMLIGYVMITAFPRLAAIEVPETVATASIGTGISAIIGTYVVGCIIMPDYSRFIRRSRDAMIAAGVALGPVWAAVLGCYAMAGLVTQSYEPMGMLLALGLPPLLTLLLPLGVLQSGIMSLYSSALASSTVLRRVKFGHILLVTMLIGMALAAAGAETAFVNFLVLLAFVFPPATAILVCEGIFGDPERRHDGIRWHSLAIWAIGTTAAVLCHHPGPGITRISGLDGFIVTFALAYLSIRLRRGRVARAT